MIALTTPYLWYTTRATGMVALVLFTLVVSMGTFVANRIGGTVVGRFEINELHRSLSIIAMTFLGLHITTTVIDSYVSTGLISAFVPFTSSYKTIPVAIGAVAFDLFLAVWISSLLKVRIKNATWRFIHWFSWLGYTSAIVHGYLTGTDSRHTWGFDVVIVCTVFGAGAALWRYLGRPTRAGGRTALSPLSMPHPNKKTVQAPYASSSALTRVAPRDGFARQPSPKRQKGRR
jgi:methionine sulfoxide reductase heme-binding subunit